MPIYIPGEHAILRWGQRVEENLKPSECRTAILNQIWNGALLVDTGSHHYIANGDFIFPCCKQPSSHSHPIYLVKTVLVRNVMGHGVTAIQ